MPLRKTGWSEPWAEISGNARPVVVKSPLAVEPKAVTYEATWVDWKLGVLKMLEKPAPEKKPASDLETMTSGEKLCVAPTDRMYWQPPVSILFRESFNTSRRDQLTGVRRTERRAAEVTLAINTGITRRSDNGYTKRRKLLCGIAHGGGLRRCEVGLIRTVADADNLRRRYHQGMCFFAALGGVKLTGGRTEAAMKFWKARRKISPGVVDVPIS